MTHDPQVEYRNNTWGNERDGTPVVVIVMTIDVMIMIVAMIMTTLIVFFDFTPWDV